jgi:endonuclease YncB( thermonuclease family)
VPSLRRSVICAASVALALASASAGITPPAQAATTTSWGKAKVIQWIDGDTVLTSAGKIRLIGIDTPERGQAGYSTATYRAGRLAPAGSYAWFGNPSSVKDYDKYGRKLRYVKVGTTDVGAKQIIYGARARYDSIDGYQWHPYQSTYRALDARYPNYR